MNSIQISKRLRDLLLAHPEGLTAKEVSQIDGNPQKLILTAFCRNYGFYIAGWQKTNTTKKHRAIWKVVQVPENAKRPSAGDDFDAYEAQLQENRLARKVANDELIKQRIKARAELKAQNEKEKLERKQRKEDARMERLRIKAEELKDKLRHKAERAGGKDYIPRLTQIRGPWPTEARA